MILNFLPCILMAALAIGALWVRAREKSRWNNGICAEHNEPWVSFDVDSQGGRGYKCRGTYMWISYGFDRPQLALTRVKKS